MDVWDFTGRIVDCEREYQTLNETFRNLIIFHQFVSFKNTSWSKDKVTHWIIVVEEKRAREARWREEQRNPAPIRSRQLCYSCKVPWEPDHICRGKGKKHIIEVHYDSDDEVCEDAKIDSYLEEPDDDRDSCTEASDSCMLEEDSDPCALEEQWDGQDDSTGISTNISHGVDDPTPQQSGDTSGDSHILAHRSDELPMRAVTHFSSFQAPTIATSDEDISGMSDMMEEPCVRDAHHGHVDPQIQEEIHDVQTVDLTLTYQHEESGSLILETPLFDQVVEIDSWMGHLLPRPSCSCEDVPFIGKEDHSTFMDTSIWDPSANDSRRVSAQEDTTAHTGYNMIQKEPTVDDDI
jgi:hypothetical protein